MKARTFLFPLLAALVALAGCDGLPEAKWVTGKEERSAAAGGSAVQSPAGPVQAPAQALPDFAAIVDANKAAVVNITATSLKAAREVPQLQSPFGGGEGDPFEEFFRRFQGPQPNVPRQGLGSGFIIDPNGKIAGLRFERAD